MPDTISYRPASLHDENYIYELYMHPDVNPYLVFDQVPVTEFHPVFQRLLSEGEMMIAEQNGEAVGTYHLFTKEYRQSGTVYLATLVVDPVHKRKGMATAILRHIIDTSRAQGKNRLELEVSVNNPNAVGFYEKMGFETEGRIRQSYRIGNGKQYYDDYRMAILL